MNTDTEITPVEFLREKICDIRSALFFSQAADILKMPTSIINVLRVDDEGQVWFFVNRPQQYLGAFKKEFPAQLNFFRKGRSFFLKITGKACIVNKTATIIEELAVTGNDIKESVMQKLVLIKVKIFKAEYVDNSPREKIGWWSNLVQSVQQWFNHDEMDAIPLNFNHYKLAKQNYTFNRA
ncbi:MAG TPA: pyridoxamine 5'-phosphate oxidase family protein [Chitinophagaceae bacterium]|nr:pyridoxamine 5'-phosphate oxidase family protein [Chitinophagaceae bacterium]